MKWSFSEHLAFKECPRKWYFSYKIANAKSRKEPIRREAFYLKQIRTIESWRGNLVDEVISDEIIPSLVMGSAISLEQSLLKAKDRFDSQLVFAQAKRWRSDQVTKSSNKDYLALKELDELNLPELLNQAWIDIQNALTNFYEMPELWELLKSAKYLKPQEMLGFYHYGNYVTCKPDLILLFDDGEPMIADWKVHKYGVKNYLQQLALYSLALIKSDFRKRYPIEFAGVRPNDVRLKEVQLLTKRIYRYDISDSEITEIKNLISTSIRNMSMILADYDESFTYLDVPTTDFAEKCERCEFNPICYENSKWEKEVACQESKQISFL